MNQDNPGCQTDDLLPCAVILTALQLEARAVLEHLDQRGTEKDRVGTMYSCGIFTSDDVRWKVAVAECGPGNQATCQIAAYAIMHFEPRVILFVGVAGSLKTEVCLGHVVASTKIYNYHSGKAAKEFLPRAEVENTSFELEQLARAIARHDKWQKRIRRQHPEQGAVIQGHVGPIASGEQVVANKRSNTCRLIKQFHSDALAVEMEGHGTLAAARIPKIDAIVIRAISDNVVDKAGCDGKGWQPFAAHNASAFAFEILANYRVIPGAPVVGPQASSPGPLAEKPPVSAVPHAEIQQAPVTIPDESPIRLSFAAASDPLLKWPTDLGRGEWLLRPELRTIREEIDSAPYSTALLLGVPGSGKSALLARLGQELAERGVPVLAIKADVLGEEVRDSVTLASFLQLPAPVGACVRQLASSGKVAILIDQLDALAALVDLRTGRLNALLNLVRDLDGIPNVHVVCSCREFEHRHDTRLTAIEADVVQLSLPTWEQIAEVLRERGLVVEGWPEPFRELLRIPQYLKVFLQRLTDPHEQRVFASYQEMLDDLWAKHVNSSTGPAGRSELLMDVAAAMAERESLWVPVALFEERKDLVDRMIGVGILTHGEQTTRVGFSHQTLFEHAWARAFARERSSLSDYSLARQDGLFIRSTVWAGLHYLRGADPANYKRQFGRLWTEQNLRRHLRHLLIEFLGIIPDADTQEQVWIFQALADPTLRPRALVAVRGNHGWFAILAESHLPQLMQRDSDSASLVLPVLIAAWPFAKDGCLKLLRDNWYGEPEKDHLTLHTLMHLTVWDAQAVVLACDIVKRSPINRGAALHVATQVVATAPALAPQIVAAAWDRELQESECQPDPTPEPLPENASETDRVVQQMTFDGRERFRRLLEDVNGWFGIEEIAEAAPREFVQLIWPLFVRTVDHLLLDPAGDLTHFRQDRCLGLVFDDEDQIHYSLSLAIDTAIRGLARESPQDFLNFLEAEQGRDSETLQRFLARALVEIATTHPDIGFRFLVEDERRLELGSYRDDHLETVRLIQALAPHLTQQQCAALESTIMNWSRIHPDKSKHDASQRFEAERYNRRRRLRLLSAIPPDRLSPEVRRLLPQETLVFPDHSNAGVSNIEGGFIGSPMSSDQMLRAKNKDIVRLFQVLSDATESSHPRYRFRGGSSQASGEFERFATASPKRAVAILPYFQPGLQERPAGAALVGLAKSSCSDQELFGLIAGLDARGFKSQEFRVEAARALEQRLNGSIGLPESICQLLERWLSEPWPVRDRETTVGDDSKEQRPASVLWHRGGMMMIPYGTYHLLHALTFGYLLRKPPAAERWLSALEAHCERPEGNGTWQVLSHDLHYLHLCERERVVRLLRRLFERFPRVLASQSGAILLTHVWSFVPTEVLWEWLARLRNGQWSKGAQAYGELITLRALVFGDDEQAQRELTTVLDDVPTPPSDIGRVRTGVAFACAHLWADARTRQGATEKLLKLIPVAENEVAQAVMHLFAITKRLLPDEATHSLLVALVANPRPLAYSSDGWFIERLEALLPNEAHAVYQLCRETVRLHNQALGSMQSGWAMHTANLTNVALTLHRLGEPLRAMGLELFEALLDLRLPETEAALREIDRRGPSLQAGPMLRPRRRRRLRAGDQKT